MKVGTRKVIEQMPFLESYLNNSQGDTLGKLDMQEQVFLKLIQFFEDPKDHDFNLKILYDNLDNDSLEFALECIHSFFLHDTYLINEPTHSIITDGDYYLSQTRFAEYLNENGIPFDRAKMSMYIKRGKMPKPDITISGIKYWEKLTCEIFLEEQLKKGDY